MSDDSYLGTQTASDGNSEFNSMLFMMRQVLNRANTSTLVQIKAVTNTGGVSPVGFVDVVPLVAQLDGGGNAVPHSIVFNLPYQRVQGGTNAIIIDPQPGDIGIAIFADHDISAVKVAKGAATPGSFRRFDMADGMYIGGVLNGTPAQYVQFVGSTINIVSLGTVHITAPNVTVDSTTATITATGSAAVTAPSINVGASGQSLLALVTSAFQTLFNGHTHASSGAGVPNQQMGATHLTSTVKGG